ncbi:MULTISPECIES: biotin-dependent carboxyltransferase family protein [Halomonas]|uniref:5-oxoprolinase subunit C family protein n=1 Tax=Halomonas TaxID=2745 RepID=UPI001C9618DC|nr:MULTISPECIES: biotin-dependent carboxyltransferase family protein [Halomonas]MBY6207964.1 biotin-dependent carboxyltransferase family protein [Halomonas sp. DP3Y7-2]MBY6228773.1 biotin-dependent carboxyltransferase family protein [Halomonas sp. DP3Y7-1]MCA0917243.1 biotin-dependent carboxyltransferase family protein [Halomonas denitrificans]
MSIEVIKPGLATSVQDAGRAGHYHLGIPPSGAMDQFSMRAANLLLGNAEDAAVLECALMGPELRFTRACRIATGGAEMVPKIDGQAQPTCEVLEVAAGSVLSFDFVRAGARLYLAVEGGIDVPERLGSRSTYALGALGGVEGRPLKTGDVLPLGQVQSDTRVQPGRRLPEEFLPRFAKHYELRVVPGLYDHLLDKQARDLFYQEDWSVASEADRIGYRFKGGTPLQFVEREPPFGAGDDPSNIVDACYPIGSIQVPAGSEPIILHRDAVSGGGYAMVGTVISADMDLVGQIQPHQKVRFVAVSLDQALDARKAYAERLDALRQALGV